MTPAERQRRRRQKLSREGQSRNAEPKRAANAALRPSHSEGRRPVKALATPLPRSPDRIEAIARQVEEYLKEAPHISVDEVLAAVHQRLCVRGADGDRRDAQFTPTSDIARMYEDHMTGVSQASLAVEELILRILVEKGVISTGEVVGLLNESFACAEVEMSRAAADSWQLAALRNTRFSLEVLKSATEVFGRRIGKYPERVPDPDQLPQDNESARCDRSPR